MKRSDQPPSFSVVVPTYRRPESLAVCLRALCAQDATPAEVLVGFREDDELTRSVIEALTPEQRSLVKEVTLAPGSNLAESLRACIGRSRGDLIALTDDDAEPPTDWLRQLRARFADPAVAAVGGRDLLPGPAPEPVAEVGRVQWFGRVIGRHHAGQGGPRDVELLKGVNCAFRGEALRGLGVDERLIGRGNVVHWEMAMCLPLRRAGWRIVYDPAVTLDHHVAPRQDGDDNHRGGFNAAALADMVHNETFLLLEHLTPAGRLAFAAWATLVGTRLQPGALQALRLVATGGSIKQALRRLAATQRGRVRGAATWLRPGPTPPAAPAEDPA